MLQTTQYSQLQLIKQENAPFLNIGVGVTCGLIGLAGGWYLRGENQTFPVNIEYRKNTITPVIPVLERISFQPDIQGISSGMTPDTNASGAFFHSGAFYNNNGETYGTGYDAIPNQQDDVIHPDN